MAKGRRLDTRLVDRGLVGSRERARAMILAGRVTVDGRAVSGFLPSRCTPPGLPPFLWGSSRGADVGALVKPQLEAGRDEVGPRGLVMDPVVHEAILARVTDAAAALTLRRVAMTPSAITGATGNQEYFLHLKSDA